MGISASFILIVLKCLDFWDMAMVQNIEVMLGQTLCETLCVEFCTFVQFYIF
jgi:hypothetical protein